MNYPFYLAQFFNFISASSKSNSQTSKFIDIDPDPTLWDKQCPVLREDDVDMEWQTQSPPCGIECSCKWTNKMGQVADNHVQVLHTELSTFGLLWIWLIQDVITSRIKLHGIMEEFFFFGN